MLDKTVHNWLVCAKHLTYWRYLATQAFSRFLIFLPSMKDKWTGALLFAQYNDTQPPLQLSPPLHYLQCSVPGGWDWREGDNPFAVFVNANDSPFALIIKPKLYPPFNEVWIYNLEQSYNASDLVGLPWLAHTVPHTIQPCCMYWTWETIRESAPKELVLVVPGASL